VTTVTLRPNSTISETFPAAHTPMPSGTSHGVTSDNSDSTYIEMTGDSSGNVYWTKLNLGTVTLPAGARTKTIKTRARARASGTIVSPKLWARTYTSTGANLAGIEAKVITATITTYSSATNAVNLSQTQINALQIWVGWNDFFAEGRAVELYTDLVYATVPVCAVLEPTGTMTAITSPAIVHTHTPGSDGGPQTFYRHRVFSQAQYSIAGFNPATSPGVWDTGNVASSATRRVIGVALVDGTTYRAYAATAQTINGSAQWSSWAFSQFSVDLTDVNPPVISGVTATATDATASIEVEASLSEAGGSDWGRVTIERSADDGATWEFVRSGTFAKVTDEGYVDLPGLSGNYLSTPDAAALDIVGDIGIGARIAPANPIPGVDQEIIGKRSSGTTCSYRLILNDDGTLIFAWSADGTAQLTATSTLTVPVAADEWTYVFATLDVNNGASGRDIRFWTSDDGTLWEQLGDIVTQAGVTSIFNSSSPLEIGSTSLGTLNLFDGKISHAQVRSGIGAAGAPGGTTVFSFDSYDIPAEPAGSFTATTGQTVTVNRSGTDDTLLVPVPGGVKTFTVVDYEARNAVDYRYRAQAHLETVLGLLSGPWVETSGETHWTGGIPWLKSADDPELSRTIRLATIPQIDVSQTSTSTLTLRTSTIDEADAITELLGSIRQVGVFHILGASRAVAISDNGSPLLLQFPAVYNMHDRWLALTGYVKRHVDEGFYGNPGRVFAVEVVEIDRPADTG
jgi:hypothetical protein